jgi:hypothetical protein
VTSNPQIAAAMAFIMTDARFHRSHQLPSFEFGMTTLISPFIGRCDRRPCRRSSGERTAFIRYNR